MSADGAAAEFDNGVLRVSLPKREETKARKIEVIGYRLGRESDRGRYKEQQGKRLTFRRTVLRVNGG